MKPEHPLLPYPEQKAAIYEPKRFLLNEASTKANKQARPFRARCGSRKPGRLAHC
jgi:hypothetical protein